MCVLGPVRTSGAATVRRLSSAKQHTLACLVGRGGQGISASDVVDEVDTPVGNAALRMAMARLREHLPAGALPDAVAGRYTLRLTDEQVDLWHLRALVHGTSLDGLSAGQLIHLLSPDEPFVGSRHGDLLDDEARLVPPMQLQLVNRVAAERPELLTGDVVQLVERHAREYPTNELLLTIAASCIARSGDRRRAIALLADGNAALRDAGLSPSRSIRELESELLGDPELPMPTPPLVREPSALPAAICEQFRLPYVGAPTPRARLDDHEPHELATRISVIVAPSGSGTTRLCAEYASGARSRRLGVVYAVASEMGDGAFGALVAALPRSAEPVTRVLTAPTGTGTDKESRRAAAWQILGDALDGAATENGLAIVVDDCQWADSYLLEFIAHLIRAAPERRLHLVLAGRPVVAEHPWSAVQQIARRAGALAVEPPVLDVDAFVELVGAARPGADPRAIAGAARRLQTLSEGRPGPALLVLAGLDEHLLGPSLDDHVGASHAIARQVAPLSLATRTVGATVSIIGRTSTIEQISLATRMSTDDVLAALDELVRIGLVVERSVVDFDATDMQARAALIAGVLQVHRLELTARVAATVERDVHRRAQLLARAVPVVAAATAAHELRTSARELGTIGLHREAADAFVAARTLDPDHDDLDDAALYTRSLELSGAAERAAVERADAVRRAVMADDHAVALRIATSGLPESEPLEGAATVIELLGHLDLTRLGDDDRWRHAAVLARQHALRGEIGPASAHAERATSLARTADQQFGAAIAHRMVLSAATPPTARIARLAPLADVARSLGDERWAEFAVMQAVDHYELGDLDAVARWVDELEYMGDQLPALRRWHLLLLRGTQAADDGRADDAERIRLHARRFANATGLHEGDVAYLGAAFATACISRTDLPQFFDPGATSSPAATTLALAALSVGLARAGRQDEALHTAEAIARTVADAPVSGGAVALAMAAEQLAHSEDRELVGRADSLLAARGDSLLVVGAGVVCLGPVARYRAQLATTPDEQDRHLRAALELARRTGSRLWQTIIVDDLERR